MRKETTNYTERMELLKSGGFNLKEIEILFAAKELGENLGDESNREFECNCDFIRRCCEVDGSVSPSLITNAMEIELCAGLSREMTPEIVIQRAYVIRRKEQATAILEELKGEYRRANEKCQLYEMVYTDDMGEGSAVEVLSDLRDDLNSILVAESFIESAFNL